MSDKSSGARMNYNYVETSCADLKIVFISDERTPESGHTDIHMHSFWELFYLRSGALTATVESREHRLSAESLMLIPPNTYHSTCSDANAEKRSVFFTFEKGKERDGQRLFDQVNAAFDGCGCMLLPDGAYAGMLLERILIHQRSTTPGSLWRVRANIAELILHLYDRICDPLTGECEVLPRQDTQTVYKYAIERLLDIYYAEDISLDRLSTELGLSPKSVTRIISTAYGKSFNELKQELKMRNAKRLLRETAFSVQEIGSRIGYTTVRGFLSAFRKYEGCTPSQYRKHCQQR